VVQTGGQLCVLQACLRTGMDSAQRESVRASTLVWLVFWTHWTCRVCSPPPQLWLHTPHSPTDQLGQHTTQSPLSKHAQLLNHLNRQAWRTSWMITWWLYNNSNRSRPPVLLYPFLFTGLCRCFKVQLNVYVACYAFLWIFSNLNRFIPNCSFCSMPDMHYSWA